MQPFIGERNEAKPTGDPCSGQQALAADGAQCNLKFVRCQMFAVVGLQRRFPTCHFVQNGDGLRLIQMVVLGLA
ncbi:hypothetical protein D3C78_1714390 [compost metagenome]